MNERDDMYGRLAAAMHATVDPIIALDGITRVLMEPGREFVVYCAAPIHDPLDVVSLYPEGLLQSMFHKTAAWLDTDTDAVFNGTLREALLDRPDIRRRYRLACPVCGDSGAVVELREHHLEGFRRLLDMSPSVSRMDISALARYLS